MSSYCNFRRKKWKVQEETITLTLWVNSFSLDSLGPGRFRSSSSHSSLWSMCWHWLEICALSVQCGGTTISTPPCTSCWPIFSFLEVWYGILPFLTYVYQHTLTEKDQRKYTHLCFNFQGRSYWLGKLLSPERSLWGYFNFPLYTLLCYLNFLQQFYFYNLGNKILNNIFKKSMCIKILVPDRIPRGWVCGLQHL